MGIRFETNPRRWRNTVVVARTSPGLLCEVLCHVPTYWMTNTQFERLAVYNEQEAIKRGSSFDKTSYLESRRFQATEMLKSLRDQSLRCRTLLQSIAIEQYTKFGGLSYYPSGGLRFEQAELDELYAGVRRFLSTDAYDLRIPVEFRQCSEFVHFTPKDEPSKAWGALYLGAPVPWLIGDSDRPCGLLVDGADAAQLLKLFELYWGPRPRMVGWPRAVTPEQTLGLLAAHLNLGCP